MNLLGRNILFGARGTLGVAIISWFKSQQRFELLCPTRREVDLSNKKMITEYIQDNPSSLVINCAAFNDVNAAQKSAEMAELATLINGDAPGYMAWACKKTNSKFVHVGTNYGFAGTETDGRADYAEDDPLMPINRYGLSKILGERNVNAAEAMSYIVRASWLYGKPGTGPTSKINFPEIILQKARKERKVKCPIDQFGQPTWTKDLAEGIMHLVHDHEPGTYHLASHGRASRFDWAKKIIELSGVDCDLEESFAADFDDGVPRPTAILRNTKVPHLMPSWEDSVERYFSQELMTAAAAR